MTTDTQENFWSIGRIIATVVVVAMVAIIGYTLFSPRHVEESASNVTLPAATSQPSVQPEKSAPPDVSQPKTASARRVTPDFDVPTLDGRTIKLSAYKGKVLVLDFWATWCPPCRQEIPQLVRIANQLRSKGVEVVGLHIDDQGRSSQQQIRKFIQDFDINYTVGMASNDMFIAYLGEEETAIPQTLVFDRNGKVVAHLIGYGDDHAGRLDAAINKAIAGS